MKAAILDRYDKNGAALAVRDIPTPEPGAHEVLVRVHTAAVNPLDNMVIRGDVRLIVPYRTPPWTSPRSRTCPATSPWRRPRACR